MAELPEGLIVRQAEPLRVHQLNNTASIVLELCDGRRPIAEIAGVLAEAFGLEALPLAEVADCVAEFRRAGVLVDRPNHHTKFRVVSAGSADPTAEGRNR